MWSLLGSLLPLAIGVVVSPFGIVGIILVLFTTQPIRNGIGFNIGWLLAIAFWFALTYGIVSTFTVRRPAHPPSWAGAVHLVIGLVLLASAAWVFLRGRHRVSQAARASRPGEVVAAAPHVPGWMRSVPKYRFVRSLLLGFALCGFNPVDVSCIVGARYNGRITARFFGLIGISQLVTALGQL